MIFPIHLHQLVRMSSYSSQGGLGNHDVYESEFTLWKKLASIHNRDRFLQDCIEEQVLPRSAPQHLQQNNKPFSNTAREYLKEAREQLKHEAEDIKSKLHNIHLPHSIIERLKKEDRDKKEKLHSKLDHLCNNSRWRNIGREDLITNLSSHTLTQTQN